MTEKAQGDIRGAANDVAGRPRLRPWNLQALGMLLLILALGLSVRLLGITEESVWFDEFYGMPHSFDIPFSEHFSFIRSTNPDHMPFYFVFLYLWGAWIDSGALSFRLSSILFSGLTVVGLFWLGRRLHSNRAGLLAALCYAMSPLHIYYDQAIRYYAFVGVLGLVSLFVLYRLLESEKSWHVPLNGFLNALLTWTHLTTALLLPCQGLMLLLGGYGIRKTFVWCLWQLPACAAILWWLPTVGNSQVTWYTLPSFLEWLNDLLGDDAVSLSTRSLAQNSTFAFFPDALATVWLNAHWLFDVGLLGLTGVALGAAIYQALRWARRNLGAGRYYLGPRRSLQVGLLLYALLPFLSLTLLSLFWEPVLLPRYTLNGSVATYVLVGLCLARIARTRYFRVFVCVLVALYGYQLSLSMTGPTRTDWRSVGESIKAFAAPDDLVLVSEAFDDSRTGTRLLRLNLGPTEHRLRQTATLAGSIDLAAQFLEDGREVEDTGRPPRKVWLIYQHFGLGAAPELKELAIWYGLGYVERAYTDLVVARIFVEDGERLEQSLSLAGWPNPSDLPIDDLLETLNLRPETPARHVEMVRALRWAYQSSVMPEHPGDYATLANYAAEKDLEVAAAAARRAIREMPEMGWGHFALGVVQLHRGEIEEMSRSFRRSLADNPNFRINGLLQALAEGELNKARVRAQWIINSGQTLPPALLNGLGLRALY